MFENCRHVHDPAIRAQLCQRRAAHTSVLAAATTGGIQPRLCTQLSIASTIVALRGACDDERHSGGSCPWLPFCQLPSDSIPTAQPNSAGSAEYSRSRN